MSGKRVTIAQVAERAGVSAMTVSNVINGRSGASAETRRRVRTAIEDLGYVRNAAARGLKSGRTGMLGVLMLDLTTQYALEILRGIADESADAEFEVLVSASHQDATRERERVILLANGLVDGIVMVAPQLDRRTLKALKDNPQPTVVVDPRRHDVDLPRIVADNYAGMRRGTEHVLGHGHTRVAYIGGDADFDSATQRWQGYQDAMRLAGHTVDPEMVRHGDFTYTAGFKHASEIIATHRPTAIVTAADLIAFGALDAARANGLRTPEDISIIGFDDLPRSGDSVPGLTTVRQPLHDMGQLAARFLFNQIDRRPSLPQLTTVPTTLVTRDTVGPVRT